MRSRRWIGNSGIVAAVLAAGAVACGDGTSSGVAPSQARISIEGNIMAARAAALDWFASVAGAEAPISLDAPVTLDLMALPTEEDGSVVIAAGSVAVGSYQMVRLMVEDGEIVFKGPLTLGAAFTFDGGEPYAVTVPSGDQTGLKTDVSFEVTAGGSGEANAARIVFAAGTTFQNVTGTGQGGVMLAPVLRAPIAE